MGGKTPGFLFLRQCFLAFLLYATWACQGRVSQMQGDGGRGKEVKELLIPYLLGFLSSDAKTGEYKKSEDGEFPPTEGSPYILLTPRLCDLYMITNYDVKYIMKHLICSLMVSFDGLQKMCEAKRAAI